MRTRTVFLVFVLALVLTVVSLGGCHGRKPSADGLPETDTLQESVADVDTLGELLEGTSAATGADYAFDDFIYLFAQREQFQKERILFPLETVTDGKEGRIEAGAWRKTELYMRDQMYSMLLSDGKQSELAKDTAVTHVTVERLDLVAGRVREYAFERRKGLWMMVRMENKALDQTPNGAFWTFYQRFASDAAFQQRCVNDPLAYYGPDPDNDFESMEGILVPEQWPSFAPKLLRNTFYNIVYGQAPLKGKQRIVDIRGVANGYEAELTFRWVKDGWKLTEVHL